MKNFNYVRSKYSFLIALFICLVSGSANAAIFMEIPGVRGESNDAEHRDWIDVLSAGGTFTRNSCGEFSVTKEIDTAFPTLVASVVSGRLFQNITLEFTANYGGAREVYSTIILNGASITSISTSASGNDQAGPPLENIVIRASSIEIEYTPFSGDGTPGTPSRETVICGKNK